MPVDIPTRFHNLTLYEILSIPAASTAGEIKSAYRRSALKYHPDHNQSSEAGHEFAFLTTAYQILSDTDKRKIYDETQNIEDALDSADRQHSESFDEQYEYFRSMFPTVTVEDIESYREKYIDSEEELQDITHAYHETNGNLKQMYEYIPYLDADNVPRIVQIIQSKIDTKKKYSKKEIDAVVKKIKADAAREARELELMQREEQENDENDAASSSTGTRGGRGGKGRGGKKALTDDSHSKAGSGGGSSTDALVAALRAKHQNDSKKRDAWLDAMFDKYNDVEENGKGKTSQQVRQEYESVDEAEFHRIQAEMDANKKSSKQQTKNTAKSNTATSSKSNQAAPASGEKRKRGR